MVFYNSPINFQEKTILLVNTGSIKKRFIIQKLKKLGLKIIVLHKEKNWAQSYVDHFIIADTTHHNDALQAVLNFLSSHPEVKFDGVLTFWEDDVILTSRIADRLNLIGIPYSVVKRVRNKYNFRDFCRKHNVCAPNHFLIKNVDDLQIVKKNLNFPIVLKPVYGSSSAFVVKVENKNNLDEMYNYLRTNISPNIESALNDGLDILAEEYIDGEEVDIDILIQNGRIKFHSISDNYKTKEPFFVETGGAIPSNLSDHDQNSLINMVDETLEKLNIQNGCIHFEAKMSSKGPVSIEVNLRMGGDDVYNLVKRAWKVDLVENALKIALGIYIPKIKKSEFPYKYLAGKYFLPDHSGILSQYNIHPDLEKKKFIEEVNFYKKVGDSVMAPPYGYEYLGWINVSGDSRIEAIENLDEAYNLVKYEISKFNQGSFIGKTLRKNAYSPTFLKSKSLVGYSKIERIRKMSIKDQRNLHVGIAGNLYAEGGDLIEKDLMNISKSIMNHLEERGYKVSFFDFSNWQQAINDLKASNIDIVFNVCERINDSSLLEPHAASLLDIFQIPYTGSNPFTLSLCIDKIRVKKLLTYHNIPTPKWDYVYSLEDDIRDDLKYPLIVKPANTDNSIGITNDSVVTNKKELMCQLRIIVEDIGSPALIEEYISGDEYDVSILGSEEDDLRVLPLSRSIFKNLPKGYWHIYAQEAKFGPEHNVYNDNIIVQRPPKGLSSRLTSLITEIALDTYNILDCHDYGRVEVKVDENNNPYVLELNPNPSIDKLDCVSLVAKIAGMDYGDFLEEILRLAIKRYKDRPPYYHLQTNLI